LLFIWLNPILIADHSECYMKIDKNM